VRATLLIAASVVLTGCMGMTSRQPPIEVWPDMDRQPKYRAQQESRFFSDKRSSRIPVPGTVARGMLYEDEALHTGVVNNQYVGKNPLPITADLLRVGQMRFNTYCSPCHDRTGSGRGLVPQRATWIPTSLHEDRVLKFNDGEIFNVISYGRRTMPPYRFQIIERERWAIVAYVRALQRTAGAPEDVPENVRAQFPLNPVLMPSQVAPSAGPAVNNAPGSSVPRGASPQMGGQGR
jgi:mono/diheme cytochrome c family protein